MVALKLTVDPKPTMRLDCVGYHQIKVGAGNIGGHCSGHPERRRKPDDVDQESQKEKSKTSLIGNVPFCYKHHLAFCFTVPLSSRFVLFIETGLFIQLPVL